MKILKVHEMYESQVAKYYYRLCYSHKVQLQAGKAIATVEHCGAQNKANMACCVSGGVLPGWLDPDHC